MAAGIATLQDRKVPCITTKLLLRRAAEALTKYSSHTWKRNLCLAPRYVVWRARFFQKHISRNSGVSRISGFEGCSRRLEVVARFIPRRGRVSCASLGGDLLRNDVGPGRPQLRSISPQIWAISGQFWQHWHDRARRRPKSLRHIGS